MLKRRSQWQSIKAISQQMQEQLAEGDWAQIMLMQQQRQAMLDAFFSSSTAEQTEQQAAEILQLLEMNRQMTASLQQTQHEMSAAFQKFMGARAGTRTYQQISDHK